MFTGIKFVQSRDVAEIARLVRRDIAEATRTGELPPGLRVSVRVSRYSMGRSLAVEVLATRVRVLNPVRVRFERDHPHGTGGGAILSAAGKALLDALEAIANAYNRDRSDHQRDYYDTHFALYTSYASELRAEQERAILADLPANDNACVEASDAAR